jgi:L-rhamnose mutarotase
MKTKRYGSIFRIRPELVEEYKKAHDEIWPDMAAEIRRSGIRNYSIFFRADGTLFSYFECEDAEAASTFMRGTEVNARWQKAMERFFVKSDPSILGPETEDLREVFHLG